MNMKKIVVLALALALSLASLAPIAWSAADDGPYRHNNYRSKVVKLEQSLARLRQANPATRADFNQVFDAWREIKSEGQLAYNPELVLQFVRSVIEADHEGFYWEAAIYMAAELIPRLPEGEERKALIDLKAAADLLSPEPTW